MLGTANRLVDRVAIVTGAAKGIGEAIATRYASEGAKVILADIDIDGVNRVAERIESTNAVAMAVATDIADCDSVNQLFEKTIERFGALDILVNNAGLIAPTKHFLAGDKAWWDKIIGVNLTGTFLCCRKAAAIMAKQGHGSIVNLSSGGATRAHRCFAAYDASKGGIEAMSRAMALDLGPYGVRVNILVPGSIDTSEVGAVEPDLRDHDIPLGRMGQAKDMAGAAVFLASDDASYITGQSIVVDGGMLAQQRSATVDLHAPAGFPSLEDVE